MAGSYSRWVHLCCWRVPSTVWLNLPASYGADPDAFKAAVLELESITLCGFAALDEGQQIEVLAHLADKSNWASPNKKALADAEVALLCVGTPSERNCNLGLDQLRRVTEGIAAASKGG